MNIQPKMASKPRDQGPHHIVELPLTITECDRHILERRFRAKHSLRNGVLQAALRALHACRTDPSWAAARLLPRATKVDRAARSSLFAEIRERHGLTEAALDIVERAMRTSCWIGDHLEARLGRVIVKDVLKSIDGHLFLKRGLPHFKKIDDCRTVSAAQHSPLMLKGSLEEVLRLYWGGLVLPVRRSVFSESELYSLSCPLVHCRIKRIPSGHTAPRSAWRYAVQVVVKGKPMVHRPRATTGVAGIDTGPSMVGVVWRDGPNGPGHELIALAGEVVRDEKALRISARSLDRSLRAANPECYDESGRCKARPCKRTRRFLKQMAHQRRAEARAANRRRNCHGRDTNRILGNAAEVRFEGHGFKGWSALWGRQLGRGAPGLFISELSRKCVDSGGSVVKIDHWKAALSQMDVSGTRQRKPLRQRFHKLADGSGFVQRDLNSALLASHCDAKGIIDFESAKADLKAQCQGLVRQKAAEAVGDAEAARACAQRMSRLPKGIRQSGLNESREVLPVRELDRRQRRRAWLQGRIATRRTRKMTSSSNDVVAAAYNTLRLASFRV